MNRPIDIVPVPSALGAPGVGVAGGPEALRRCGLLDALRRNGRVAEWRDALVPDGALGRWDALSGLCLHLAEEVSATVGAQRMPLVLGGDHAIAAGTWRGVVAASSLPVGLLWCDAHLDAHTLADSPSGNPHGMPLAMLLGVGRPPLAYPSLAPQYVCVVGARDWEVEESERLRRFGVRVFDDAEIARRGLAEVMDEALRRVCDETAGFGISLDLDVFPPQAAPGVSSPAAGGRPAEEWLHVLRGLATRPECLAVEIVECDPARDRYGRTVRLGVEVAGALFAPAAEGTRLPAALRGAANVVSALAGATPLPRAA